MCQPARTVRHELGGCLLTGMRDTYGSCKSNGVKRIG
jgi:hypothetical protein